MRNLNAILFLLLVFSIQEAKCSENPSLSAPEFVRIISTPNTNNKKIEFELFLEEVVSLDIVCMDALTKRSVQLENSFYSIDSTYNKTNSFRPKVTLPDEKKEYIYMFMARGSSGKMVTQIYSYQYSEPELMMSGNIDFKQINAGDLKVTWDLKSSKSLDSYNYVLKIKLNDFTKTITGKFIELKESKIFENVFIPGNSYTVNFEVGKNVKLQEVRNDEIITVTTRSLDFAENSYPALVFFNNESASGINIKFKTTKPCIAKVQINSASNREEFIQTESGRNTDDHDISISKSLNFISVNNESVAYIKILLYEVIDNEEKLVKTAIFGIGGTNNADSKISKKKAKEISEQIGEVVGVGLKGLIKVFLPI
jgi:hypothetical protein